MGFFTDLFRKPEPDDTEPIYSDTAQTMWWGDIIIPNNMKEIEDRLFDGNTMITSVTVPGTVKRIGVRAFADCGNLESVTLEEGIETICSNVFTGCRKLRRVTYPDSVKNYQGWTFYGTDLKSPVLNTSKTVLIFCPASVSGQEWSVPDTVKTISRQAFYKHHDLETLHLPQGLEIIEDIAFIDCGIKEITIPYSVREIGRGAYCRCQRLEKVTILNPDTKVSNHAFDGCINIREIIFADLKESDRIFHMKGQPFLLQCVNIAANLNHTTDPDFLRLTSQCAKGSIESMNMLAEWFERLSHRQGASLFYIRAANYWRYRAYRKGNDIAVKWFMRFFAEHPGEQLESILFENNDHDSNWYCFGTPGKMLNDLGYDFFDSHRDYDVKIFEDEGIVEVGTYESCDEPDEDGFGMEEYYDWWFLDENMQQIPGVKKVNASMRERNNLKQFDNERAKAKEILSRRKTDS